MELKFILMYCETSKAVAVAITGKGRENVDDDDDDDDNDAMCAECVDGGGCSE